MPPEDFSAVAFAAESGDGPASLAPPIRRGSDQYNEPQNRRKDDSFTCQPQDIKSITLSPIGGLAASTLTIPNPPGMPNTPPFTSSNNRGITINSPTRPSSTYLTATASSSPESSPLSTPRVSVNVSNSNGSPTSLAALSSSTGTTEDDSTSLSSISSLTIPITSGSPLSPSPPSPGAPSNTSISPPPSSGPYHLNTGAVIGIVLGALATVLASALAIFLLLRKRARRRGRSKSKHTSVESSESRQRLEACSYSDGTSRPASSVLTFRSALTPGGPDYDYEPKREPGGHSSAPTETRPLAGDASVHSLHEGVLNVPAPLGPEVPSASSELLALAGTDFAMANALNLNGGGGGLRRSGSGLSRTTASSRDIQSVEAL